LFGTVKNHGGDYQHQFGDTIIFFNKTGGIHQHRVSGAIYNNKSSKNQMMCPIPLRIIYNVAYEKMQSLYARLLLRVAHS
jgi:hypothetical protein